MNGTSAPAWRIGGGYAIAIFLSSSLLFLTEPLAGKRVVPLLGGSAAVWAACLVFFQSALLLGYFVAHWLVTRTAVRAQVVIFAVLLALSMAQLAMAVEPHLRADVTHPIPSVLWLLTTLIGIPFITLSAASPLLQSWFARATRVEVDTDGKRDGGAARPYRLFAVSNVGSLLALVLYPWLVEPRLSVRDQAMALVLGFLLLFVALALIVHTVWRSILPPSAQPESPAGDTSVDDRWVIRVLWICLAVCPSLLLSAVTNHLSQNVAAIPLLWIVPLVLYLLSFVVAFSSERWRPRELLEHLAMAGMAGIAYYQFRGDYHSPILRVVATYSFGLFFIAVFCHSELYARRPAPARLTTFYLCVATGGAVGAVIVGVIAPTVLTGTHEVIGGLCLAAILGLVVTWSSGWVARGFWIAASLVATWVLVYRVQTQPRGNLVRVRNFYGTLRVSQTVADRYYRATVRTLFNGIIQHGKQVFRVDLGTAPTTYYGRTSGIGLALDNCCGDRPRRIGVIGLGIGTIAAFGRPGDVIRFYDINPAVEPIARNYFAYLRNSPARNEVVIGDARVSLSNEPPQNFDVIAVDAFTGDAIPVHLLTTQALELYRRHLTPNGRGIIGFHVSNQFLDLGPVVEQVAKHAGLKSASISSRIDRARGLDSATWVLVTADETFLKKAVIDSVRQTITVPPRLRLWTDDYNSLLPILRKR